MGNLPKGTRDFSSMEIMKRNVIIQTIKKHFKLFGFYPIETSSIEEISTLVGKYGEEGNSLIFKILQSGNVLKNNLSSFLKTDPPHQLSVNDHTIKLLTECIAQKALRYDLTVPFIRYVSMHQHEIIFPFRRYQIQPVWRADKPQKGRYREFYQCDADIMSYSSSLWEEIELIKLCDNIFTDLNLPVIISINHIEILKGLAEITGLKTRLWKSFLLSLDKWKKIGKSLVKKEMMQMGVPSKIFEKISLFLEKKKDFFEQERLFIKDFQDSEKGKKGMKEMKWIFQTIQHMSFKNIKLEWNLSLARGMSYYTGTIWEIFLCDHDFHFSLGGGGRYDLDHVFQMKNISGTGISLGLDRIYLSMEKKKLFQHLTYSPSMVLFINFGYEEVLYAYRMIQVLRNNGISTQLYPHAIKISNQFRYANRNHIPFVISLGKEEIKKKKIKVKNLKDRTEKEYDNINMVVHQLGSFIE
ncbi:histidine--tRNA ligase [Blattabacterium cuenoti]|uniref:histidine--tRNA ligase n=1 Tax=Blattabacterium cuenoti TaxID=1653831 RepID=UPI00163CABC7|nr:histidine--tRNA ligase [Blattabacterium cuenoti]